MGFLRYYPANRITTNLSTTGNLYTLNGKPYRGPYYLTYDGNAYTGINPFAAENELLTPIDASAKARERVSKRFGLSRAAKTNEDVQTAFQTAQTQPASAQLKEVKPYYPAVTEYDYQKGYITRYFAKKVNMNSYIMEVSYEDYAKILNDTDNTLEDYEIIDMLWQVKGPRHDKRLSQYQLVGGVYDTNKRVTEAKTKQFNGLVNYIGGDYTKFARLDPE